LGFMTRRAATSPPRSPLFDLAGAAVFSLALLLGATPGAVATDEVSGQAQTQPKTARAEKYDLLLYLEDGLSAMELPAFDYPRTTAPNLAFLMGEATVFLSAYSASPWTVPAVASILTSLYPSAHGLQRAGDRLPASARTLAEVLKESGYETALFSAHPLVGGLSGLDQGFDRVEEIPGPFGPPAPRGPGQTSSTLNDRILAWLDGRTSRSPTFIMVVSTDPLEPFGAPAPQGGGFLQPKEMEWYRGVRRRLLELRPGNLCLATPDDLERIRVDSVRFAAAARAVYDGALLYNDEQLGSLRRALLKRKVWEKTLFVFTSTHGEEFGEHGSFGHGSSLYDQAIRVPVVVSFPPVAPAPDQNRKATDLVDLLPTLLSWLGIPIPEGVEGTDRSVDPVPGVPRYLDLPAFAETAPAGALPTGRAAMTMTTKGGEKLILYEEAPRGARRAEIEYFRRFDPAGWESRSLVASQPLAAARQREVLASWREKQNAYRLQPDPNPPPPDPKLQDVLWSLGYLQGADPQVSPSPGSTPRKTYGGRHP